MQPLVQANGHSAMELRQSRTGIIRRVENNIVRARSIDLPGPVPSPRPFVVIESGGALPIPGLFAPSAERGPCGDCSPARLFS